MQRKKTICLILPLNYICLERPKTTTDVPRSAQSGPEREAGGGGGVPGDGWTSGGEKERQKDSRGIREQTGEQSHFQLAREMTWARGPQCSTAFCPPLLDSIIAGGFWQEEKKKKEED